MFMLLFCSIQDIKEKSISLWKLKLYGILTLGISIWHLFPIHDNISFLAARLVIGLFPGFFLLFLAKATKEAVGYGDGLVLLFIGLSMGFWECLGILLTGLLGVFLAGIFAGIYFRRRKGLRIPFIPFLFIGMAGGYFWILE